MINGETTRSTKDTPSIELDIFRANSSCNRLSVDSRFELIIVIYGNTTKASVIEIILERIQSAFRLHPNEWIIEGGVDTIFYCIIEGWNWGASLTPLVPSC
jgi:hypothetical protein